MKCALVKPIPGSQIQDGLSTKKKKKGHLLTYLCTNKSCHKEYQSNDLVRVLTRKITPLAGNIQGLSIIIYLQVYLGLILNMEKKQQKLNTVKVLFPKIVQHSQLLSQVPTDRKKAIWKITNSTYIT